MCILKSMRMYIGAQPFYRCFRECIILLYCLLSPKYHILVRLVRVVQIGFQG